MVLYTACTNTGHVNIAMPRLSCRILPLLALLLLPLPADAVRVENLYRTEVKVIDKSGEEREAGFRRALEQILLKVSGSMAVLEKPALQPMLDAPARYVQQYRYEEIEDGGETDAGGDAEPPPAYRLEVVFGQSRIEDDLRERGITVWGPYRPEILVWLAFDNGRQRQLVGADDGSGMDEVLRTAADRRGMPLLLPLLDTEDHRRIEYLDVQGGFFDSVREASERYGADIVLVGHVRRTGGDWSGAWTLLEADERRGWQTRAAGADAVVQAGVGRLVDHLSEVLAGRDSERSRVRVRVLDTDSLDDYARLGHYFERLPRVQGSHVVRITPQEILFELDLHGRLTDLERAIALDDLLQPVETSIGEDGPVEVIDISEEEGAEEDEEVEEVERRGDGVRMGDDADAVTRDPLGEANELVFRFTG